MNKKKTILKIVILAIVFFLLANPGWIPFCSDGVRNAIAAEMKNTFGIFTGGTIGALAPARILSAIAAAILVYLLTTIAGLLLEKLEKGRKRSQAIAILLGSLVKVVGLVAGLVWVLSVLGVNLGAIFASLGIASLVIGFGVQSLIEDCVTGIFIILEGTYHTGDIIVLEDFRGTVTRITMRTTTIQDGGGNLKVINNSDIRNVQNRSSSVSCAVCDVGISYDADLKNVEAVIAEALPEIYERNMDVMEDVPTYAGVQMLADSAVILRYMVNVKEENIFVATRRLNREMKLLLDEKGIEIPYPQMVIHSSK